MKRIRALFLLSWMLLPGAVGHSQDAGGPALPAEDPLLQPTPGPDGQIPKDKTKPPVFKWDAGLGYATYLPFMKPGCWYPVWVKVEAVNAAAKGDIVLTQPDNPIEVRIPVSVEKGSAKFYKSYYKLSPPSDLAMSQEELTAEIRVKGCPAQSIPLNYRVADLNAQHVLILSDETGTFNFLNRGARQDSEDAIQHPREWSVIYGKPDLLPDNPIGLEAVDAIILNGSVVRQITPGLWQVIQDWMAGGGRLLLAGGAHQPFIEQSVLANAHGLKIGPPLPERIPAFEGEVDSGIPGSGGNSRNSVLVAAPQGDQAHWDRIWLGEVARPLVAGKRVGKGWFEYCAFDLGETNLRAMSRWRNAWYFWEQVLERSTVPGPMDQIAENGVQSIEKGLQNTFVIHLAPLGWVFAYLLLYNLLALPVNRWLCRRYGRPEWSWTILFLVAVCFAVFGYYSGLKRQSRSFQVNELLLVRKEAEAQSARATAIDVVFSPRRFRADVQAGGLMFPVPVSAEENPSRAPVRTRTARSAPAQPSYRASASHALTFGAQTVLKQVTLFPFAAKSYTSGFTVENAGRIAVRQSLRVRLQSSSPPAGQLVNETPWTFERCWLGDGKVFWERTSAWHPGESLNLEEMTPLAQGTGWQNLVERVMRDNFMRSTYKSPNGQAQPPRASSQAQYQGPGGYTGDWGAYRRVFRPDGRFYFWGETSAEPCNLFASVSRGIRMHRMLFEQPVAVDQGAPASPRGESGLAGCSFRILRVGAEPSQDGTVYSYSPGGRMPTQIPLDLVQIEISSSVPVGTDRLRAMTLAFHLESVPGGQKFYKESDSRQAYLLSGCPVALFNYPLQKWDSWKQMGAAGEPWRIENPADYVAPQERFQMHLLVDARPNSIVYVREGDTGPKPAQLVTGKELNGDQRPQAGSGRGPGGDLSGFRRYPATSRRGQYDMLPINARIERLSVAVDQE